MLQVHTLAGAADRVRRDLVQVGAEEAVIKAKTKFAYDSLVKVCYLPCPLLSHTIW